MEQTNVRPKLTDLIPIYGGINYIFRATYKIEGEIQAMKDVGREILTSLVQVAYNGYIGAEVWNLLEGKPTLTQKILENFF